MIGYIDDRILETPKVKKLSGEILGLRYKEQKGGHFTFAKNPQSDDLITKLLRKILPTNETIAPAVSQGKDLVIYFRSA